MSDSLQKNEKWLVGAKGDPQTGKIDTSKAMHFDMDEFRRKNVVERLLSDRLRQDAQKIAPYEYLRKYPESELRKSVFSLLTNGRGLAPDELRKVQELLDSCVFSLSRDNVSSVSDILATSVFPIPTFTANMGTIRALSHLVGNGSGADGFTLSAQIYMEFKNEKDTKMMPIKFIFAQQGSTQLNHETLHVIDPQGPLREGKDRVLEEFFTFYFDRVKPPRVYSKSKSTDKEGKVVEKESVMLLETTTRRIIAELKQAYFPQYNKFFSNPEEFSQYLDSIGAEIVFLESKFSPNKVLRIIGNAASLGELQILTKSMKEKSP